MLRTHLRFAALFAIALLTSVFSSSASAAEFKLTQTDDGNVTVEADGELFTRYVTNSGPKPILWPILGPGGAEMTRNFPMKQVDGEKKDHPHHRSLWFTHGEVNGIDFWAEEGSIKNSAGRKFGKIVHQKYVKVEGGATGTITTRNQWVGPDGKALLDDERTVRFLDTPAGRAIDFDIMLTALDAPVEFGDTKEGSFGIRVPTVMDVDAKKGGHIVTSEGLQDGAAWGKPAAWVDYHGPIGDQVVGTTIMNHPKSFRYPTHWHVRTYGLFAANPFGLGDFKSTVAKSGELTLEPGKSITLRYRLIFHKGTAAEAKIAEEFERYAEGN